MAIRTTVTVSVTPEQDTFIRDRLNSGRFSSASEVVRARLLEGREPDVTIEQPDRPGEAKPDVH